MQKTLLKNLTENTENQPVAAKGNEISQELIDLMKEMKGSWNEASNDLLQPRKEVLDQLLKKVLH